MAGEMQDSNWPLPKFYFPVKIDNSTTHFQEIYGLDVEAQVIENSARNSGQSSKIKMPGIKKSCNVTLKKGVFARDSVFWSWCNQNPLIAIRKVTVTISLLDQTDTPTMVWTLINAWPVKITGADMKADGNQMAVETIEIAYETLTVANG